VVIPENAHHLLGQCHIAALIATPNGD
jgi:hypothetical protein